MNLDFYVEAEEFGTIPAEPPGPGWIRIKMLTGHYHDIPAGESAELRRRLDALAGIEPPAPPPAAQQGAKGEGEGVPLHIRSAPVRPTLPAVDDPPAEDPQQGGAL